MQFRKDISLEKDVCLHFIKYTRKYKNDSLAIKKRTDVRYLKNIFKEEKYINYNCFFNC